MVNQIFKRFFDISFSFMALIVCLPLFLIISLLIVIESGFPIIYKQKRIGKNYKEFTLYKFRSMIKDADKKGALVTAGHDPRITKMGRFLRKTKLDELPQFFNVLIGDMSVVGPRPEVEKYARYYQEDFKYILSKVKPGITDRSSIEYRNEEKILANKENHENIYINELLPKKVKIAKEYADNNDVIYDIIIIVKTALTVLFKH
ncbi:MAG: sugar transferase [Exilispira sp.]|nr:sugar transferase [Exilispira sp.]